MTLSRACVCDVWGIRVFEVAWGMGRGVSVSMCLGWGGVGTGGSEGVWTLLARKAVAQHNFQSQTHSTWFDRGASLLTPSLAGNHPRTHHMCSPIAGAMPSAMLAENVSLANRERS